MLMELALARDAARAIALLGEHFESTTRTVLASLPGTSPSHIAGAPTSASETAAPAV